ncbi:MAG: thioredoxin [Myxococcota bacterium]
MALIDATMESLKGSIEGGGIVVVDFWASWCGPCRAFAPVFKAASDKHEDITFAKVDTDAEQELAAGFQIQSIPTVMVFRDQVLLMRHSGALPPAALEDVIDQARQLDMDQVRKEIAEEEAKAAN